MKNAELYKLLDAADIQLDKGNYPQIRKIINQIEALPLPQHISAYFSSGLLINIGAVLGDVNPIREGKTLLESNFEKI